MLYAKLSSEQSLFYRELVGLRECKSFLNTGLNGHTLLTRGKEIGGVKILKSLVSVQEKPGG